jgi:hypothetical protein
VQLSGYGSICLYHCIVTQNYVCFAINMPDVFLISAEKVEEQLEGYDGD